MLLQCYIHTVRCGMYYLASTDSPQGWPRIQNSTRIYHPTVTLFNLEEAAEISWSGRNVLVGRAKTTHFDKLGILSRESDYEQ